MPNTPTITLPILLLFAAGIAVCPAHAACHGPQGEWSLEELREVTAILKSLRANNRYSRDSIGTITGGIDFYECNGLSHEQAVYEVIRDRGIAMLKYEFEYKAARDRDEAEKTTNVLDAEAATANPATANPTKPETFCIEDRRAKWVGETYIRCPKKSAEDNKPKDQKK